MHTLFLSLLLIAPSLFAMQEKEAQELWASIPSPEFNAKLEQEENDLQAAKAGLKNAILARMEAQKEAEEVAARLAALKVKLGN